MAKKADYQKWLWQYKRRREELRKHLSRMTIKMKIWNKAIQRIEARENKIKYLLKSVNEYFNVDIREKTGGEKVILARRIYFKYGLEVGLRGDYLEEQIGFPKRAASRSRRQFSQSFPKHPVNRISFHKFKDYIGDINQINIPTKLKKAS